MVNSICVCVCITWPWPLPKRPCVSLAVTKCGPCRFTSSHSRTSCLMAGRGHQAPPPFSTRTLKRAMEHSLLIGSRWRHFERPQTRVVDSVEKSNTTEPVPLSDFWLVGFFFNTWNLKKNENWNCSERNPSWRHCQYVGHLRWQAKKNIEDEPISIKLYPKQKKRFDRVNQNNFQGFFFNFWVSFEDVRSIFFFVGSRVRWKCFVIFFCKFPFEWFSSISNPPRYRQKKILSLLSLVVNEDTVRGLFKPVDVESFMIHLGSNSIDDSFLWNNKKNTALFSFGLPLSVMCYDNEINKIIRVKDDFFWIILGRNVSMAWRRYGTSL